MTLTLGNGALSERPAGHFNFDLPPGPKLYCEPVPYRVRAFVEREAIVDSRQAKLLEETGRLPVFYFPSGDVREDLLAPSHKAEHSPAKGEATYRSIRVGERVVPDAVWAYDDPVE